MIYIWYFEDQVIIAEGSRKGDAQENAINKVQDKMAYWSEAVKYIIETEPDMFNGAGILNQKKGKK